MESLEASDSGVAELTLGPRPPGCVVPLTAVQMRRFKLAIQEDRLSTRMCVMAVRVLGELNVDALKSSLNSVVRRHEALRTRFARINGDLQQLIDPPGEYSLEVVDLEQSANDAPKEALRLAQAFVDEQIDLFAEPLFAAKLIRLSPREHALIVMLDHMVCDAVSCLILSKEIWALYEAAEKGQPCSLPKLPLQYPDYAVWQQHTYSSWLKTHGAYWQQRLTGVPNAVIPSDAGATEVAQPQSAMLHLSLGHELSAKLRDFAKRQQILLPLVVLTLYATVMSHWCKQTDLLIEFLTHGRYRHPELENMIGDLASSLYLRITVAGQDSYLDLLRKIDQEFSSAHIHHDHGQLQRTRLAAATDLTFNWLPGKASRSSPHRAHTSTNPRLHPLLIRSAFPAKFYPFFSDSAAGIGATVHFQPDRVAIGTIRQFGRYLQKTACELIDSPSKRNTDRLARSQKAYYKYNTE